jgi:hypothetical protein
MKPKPSQCEKIYLTTNLLPNDFSLLVIGIDESSNALVFEEVNSSKLEEFKTILGLYSSHYEANIWMYKDEILESELKKCQIKSVQSCTKTDTLAIITDSFLQKKKLLIESSLSLRKRLGEFKGQNPSSVVLALFCAVEQLQDRLNNDRQPMRLPLVSISPRIQPQSSQYPQYPYRRY